MQFNSTLFLFFLPAVAAAYWFLQPRHRRYLLLLSSYTFYWVWSVPFSGLLLLSTLVDYFAARVIVSSEKTWRRRAGLLLSLVMNLGILGLFKYSDFFSDTSYSLFGARPWPNLGLVLPLGISFYTFQTMSYTIDVYRGVIQAKKSLLDVALYVSFFPQLVAGPIVRAGTLIPQLQECADPSSDRFLKGLSLVIWGLAKKVFFADAMAVVVNEAYRSPGAFGGPGLLLATYAFAVQIYCDFSAYSDIAIGAAGMMGIDLPKNFDKPYLASSVREFWRRWHISLSTWLRDYLYIPLGGNRKGEFRTYLNLMITMLLGGLWHGAGWSWVLWGGAHGIALSGERWLGVSGVPPRNPVWRLVRWLLAFHFVCLTWVLFRARSLENAGVILSRILTMAPGEIHVGFRPLLFLILLLAAELGKVRERWTSALSRRPALARWAAYGAFLVFLLVFAKVPNPEFIYFQF